MLLTPEEAAQVNLADHEPAQIAQWGKVMFRAGPWPAGQPRIEPDSWAWEDAREAECQEAWAIEDPKERRERMHDTRNRYGPAPRTSVTLGAYLKVEINE